MTFDLYMSYAQGFRTLTPITDVTYTARLMDRLVAAGMTLDPSPIQTNGSIDPEKLKTKGFRSCNCPIFMKDLWCWHVLVCAQVCHLVKRYPVRFHPSKIAPASIGRIANASKGGALGYQQ